MTLSRLTKMGFSRPLSAFLAFMVLITIVPVAVLTTPQPAAADVSTINPNGNGSTGTWSYQGGTDYQVVADVNDDTTYIYTATTGRLHSVNTYGTIPSGATINSVTMWVRAKTLTDEGFSAYVRDASNQTLLGQQQATTTWTDYSFSAPNDPAGGAWDSVDFETLEAQVASVKYGGGAMGQIQVSKIWVVVNYAAASAETVVGDAAPGPSSKFVARSDSSQSVDAFTLKTTTGSDSVATMTVTGANVSGNVPANGVGIYQDNGTTPNAWDPGDTFKSKGSFTDSTATVTFSPALNVTTSDTTYIVTYNIAPAATNGAALNGYVSSITASNTVSYLDNADATLTVDATPPELVTGFNAADEEDGQSSLNWNNPGDSDLAEVRVMRKTGDYPADNNDGDPVFDDTTDPFAESYVDSPLTNGQTYYYAVFVKDAYGNWNTTVTVGSNADTATPAAQTTVGDGTSPSNKTVGPGYTNEAVDVFTLRTGSGTDEVTQIQVAGTNTANVAASGVKLWRDNGSTQYEWDASDTFITSGTASFSGTTATVSGISINVSTTEERYLVTYNISAAPAHNQTLTGYVSSVTAVNPINYLDNADATLTIEAEGPTVTSAVAYDATHVDITFSEAVDASSVDDESLYTITGSGGLAVTSATQTIPTKVRLTTGSQTSGAPYTVTVTTTTPTVKDLYGNNLTTANTANFNGFTKIATLTGSDTAPASIQQGATDDFIRFSLTVNSGSTTLTAIGVDKLGNLPDGDVETVDLYRSGDQTFDGNDTKLQTTTFSSGTSTLTVSEPVGESVNYYYFIVMKMAATATGDTTIGARIPANGFTVSSGQAINSKIESGSTSVTEAPDTVTVTYSNQAPRSTSHPPADSGATRLIPMLKLDLSSAPKDSTMTQIKVDKWGSMAPTSISNVRIFASDDQEFDALDTEIASGTVGTPLTLAPSQSISAAAKHYFVAFEINSGAQENETVGAAITNESYITLAGVDVVKPFGNYNSKLITMIGEPHGSPQNPFAAGTNYCAACHSVHVAKQGRRLLDKLYTSDPAVVNTGDPEIFNALCFGCHDGSGASSDVRSDYMGAGSVNQKQPTVETGDTTSPGHMTDQDGTATIGVGYLGDIRYDAGTKLPCMVCHDVHQSRNGNQMMLADELYEFASSETSGATSTDSWYWDPASSRWQAPKGTSDASLRRSRCEVCHRNSSAGSVSDTSVSPGGGSWVDGKSIVVGIDLGRPETHETGDKSTIFCGGCHGVHRIKVDKPGGSGESAGSADCGGCHGSVLTAMQETSTYHHVMESDVYSNPTDSSPAVGSTNRRCTMCHADHNVFSPAVNTANGNRGKNLRADIGVTPAANDTATFSDTDFNYNAAGGNGGICLSCHRYAQAKDISGSGGSGSPAQKSTTDTTTPILNKDDYNNAAAAGATPGHNYEATSTFAGMTGETVNKPYTFRANCLKCHNTMDQANYPYAAGPNVGSKQDSTRRFQLHATPVPRLLAWLNITEAGSQAALEEDFCVRCHSNDVNDNPNTGSGTNNDYYGVVTMNAGSQAVKAEFSGTSYLHPVASKRDKHKPVEGDAENWNSGESGTPADDRHVECEDCHNPHAAKRRSSSDPTRGAPDGGDVGGPLKGVWGVTASGNIYNTGTAKFVQGNSTVTGTGTSWSSSNVDIGWYIKSNYDMDGRWYKVTGRDYTAQTLTINANFDSTTRAYLDGNGTPANAKTVDYVAATMTYTKTDSSTKQYEVCLKCHSAYSYNDAPPTVQGGHAGSSTNVKQTDIGLDFSPDQLAHHAVLDKGKNQPIVPTGQTSGATSYWNSNWPAWDGAASAATVQISTGGVATFSENVVSTARAGWFLYIGADAPPATATQGWYQLTSGSGTTWNVTPSPSTAVGTQSTFALTAGLGNAFVPPYGPWSILSCDDCHKSETATDPEGPHGSANRWILRSPTQTMTFDWYNGTSVVSVDSNNAGITWNTTYSPKNVCINCHRRDVYGDHNGGTGEFDNASTSGWTESRFGRVPHNVAGNSAHYNASGVPWLINCMMCHGGDSMGGIHGTSAKKGLDLTDGADVGGANFRGKRFLNGASWAGVTRATTSAGVQCWVKNSTTGQSGDDEVNVCNQGHAPGSGNKNATYNYESAAD